MFFIILSILCLAAGLFFIVFIFTTNETKYIGFAAGAFGLTVVMFIFSILYIVDPGEVGIEILFGKVQKYAENGLNVKNPFSEIVKFDTRTIKEDHKAEGTSQDLQLVIVDAAIQYRIDYQRIDELYSKVGKDYAEKIIAPAIQDAIKTSTSLFKVEQIIVERLKLKEHIEAILKSKLDKFYLILQDVNLVDIDFSEEFNKVVEEKQIEEQRIKTAEYRKLQAEQDKSRVILEAQAEAEKQRLLKQNTSKEVIDLKWIEKWNGQLPTTVLGNSVPMVSIK